MGAMLLVVVSTIAHSAVAQTTPTAPPAPDRAWFDSVPGAITAPAPRPWLRQSLFITMRDGVRLAADLYLPRDRPSGQRLPTILEQTRYHRSDRRVDPAADARVVPPEGLIVFVNTGYAVLVVDVRGTGASFGTRRAEFSPEEVRDGWDVVEWIIHQPWSDGSVGATGASYPGTTAELLGTLDHPAVKAVAPRFSLFDFYTDVMFPGGALLDPFFRNWEAFVTELDANRVTAAQRGIVSGIRPAGEGEAGEASLAAAINEHAGNGRIYQQIAPLHFRDDTAAIGLSVDALSPHTQYRASRAPLPTFSISGWVDGGFGYAAIKRYLAHPGPENRLTLGPWSHGGTWAFLPGRGVMRSSFLQNVALRRFFDRQLRGMPTGIEREPPIHYFITGEDRWVGATVWPPVATARTWFLSPRGTLAPKTGANAAIVGRLAVDTMLGTGSTARWNTILGGGPVDYAPRTSIAAGAVAFTSAPLEQPLTIVGHPIVTLVGRYTSSNPTVFVYLEEVDSSGAGHLVSEGNLRLINRRVTTAPTWYPAPQAYHSFRAADTLAVIPGTWTEARIELLPLAHRFARGARIRVVITGADRDHFRLPESLWNAEFRQSRVVLPVVGGH